MEDIHIKIQKDLSLSKDDIDNIVAGALEGGITYWCTKAKVVNKEYKGGEFTNSVVSRGGSIELYEDDGSFKVLHKSTLSNHERRSRKIQSTKRVLARPKLVRSGIFWRERIEKLRL